MLKMELRKSLLGLGMFFLVVAAVVPNVCAEGDLGDSVDTSVKLLDDIHYLDGTTWSDIYQYPISGYIDTTAGGTVRSVYYRVYWDHLATAYLMVLKHARVLTTNTGNREEFIESMGSAFFGKGSYYTFSDPTGYGYEKFWVTPSRMVFYGGHGTIQISRTYTILVYAQSEEEAKVKIEAGFDELGIEASVSVIASVKVGEKVEYTATVTATVYQHYWDTEYVGDLNYHYHITNSNPGPTPLSKQVGVTSGTSYDTYDYKHFDFEKSDYIYSYEDVDMETQGITGEMVS